MLAAATLFWALVRFSRRINQNKPASAATKTTQAMTMTAINQPGNPLAPLLDELSLLLALGEFDPSLDVLCALSTIVHKLVLGTQFSWRKRILPLLPPFLPPLFWLITHSLSMNHIFVLTYQRELYWFWEVVIILDLLLVLISIGKNIRVRMPCLVS